MNMMSTEHNKTERKQREPVAQGHHVVEIPGPASKLSRGSRAHFLCEEVYPEICSLCSDISPYCFEFRHLFYLLEHLRSFFDLSAQFSWSSLWELT